MTRTLLVVPTGHGVGLTATSLGLVRALDLLGLKVGYYKPLTQPGAAADGQERSTGLIRLTTSLKPPPPIAAARVEKLISEGQIDTLMEDVVASAQEVLATSDVVVVEGLAPSSDLVYSSRANLAMAKALDADVLLVAAWGEGNPARIAESMTISGGAYRAGEEARVVGAVVNRVPDDPTAVEELRAALAQRDLRLVGAVPYRAELSWPRVGDLLRALDLEVLNEGDQDRRIKDVIIAAQAAPAVLPLLKEGRLIVVPGDRDEVVLAACLAAMNGVRLAALLLTVNTPPDPRVWELARPAAATGLPILLSRDYTYETANLVHGLDPEVPVDDRERALLMMSTVAEALDKDWLSSLPTATHAPRLSPAAFRQRLTTMARQADRRIVLPEGDEPRTVQAAVICSERGIARPVLLGDPEAVRATAAGLGLELPAALEILDPRDIVEDYVDELVAARANKGLTPDLARDQLADRITLGTTMVRAGVVDGLVAGAVHTTAATVRPALQILRTAPGAKLVSSVFFMCLPDQVVIYGDCAVNPDPDPEQLADIAIQSARSATAFGIEPQVAMISFSTGSSGGGTDVDKVAEATRIAREREPGLALDGPLQYDAAAIASVARSKAPDSPVAGRATVFVFPDLNTGNTTYKAVQRSADVISIGPMLQGLSKPVNDLSRGALVEDIVYTIALTAIQAAMAPGAPA